MTRRQRRNARLRRGFVLLAVLWLLVGLASLSLLLSLAGRDTVAAARNRVSLTRAHWLAEGCIDRARAAVGEALAEPGTNFAWRRLDSVVARSPLLIGAGCDVTIRAVGSAFDVNAADAEGLRRLFVAMHLTPLAADSLVDALLDWRDADDDPRAVGAERTWYAAQERLLPRNGAFADRRELRRVRGLESLNDLDSVLDVEPGRVALGRAPLPVLSALPGFTDETAQRIVELRVRDALPPDLLSLAGSLSRSGRDSLAAHYAEVVSLVTLDPDAWIVTARAGEGGTTARATVEVRLGRAGSRASVLRHRSWP
jgi:type II secretory pathway component PulK